MLRGSLFVMAVRECTAVAGIALGLVVFSFGNPWAILLGFAIVLGSFLLSASIRVSPRR